MAFSATQWRSVIANYKGVTPSNRAWSTLGQEQFEGQYYVTHEQSSYFASPRYFHLRLKNCAGPNAKNVQSFYAITAQYITFYAYYNAYGSPTYISNTIGSYFTVYSTPANVYTLANTGTGYYYSAPGSSTGYTQITYAGPVRWFDPNNTGITSTAYFFYYTPWGSAPFTAGDNVAIGRGDTGSPASGYPYQRLYINGYCP